MFASEDCYLLAGQQWHFCTKLWSIQVDVSKVQVSVYEVLDKKWALTDLEEKKSR